jgi:NSS family neurotransmitter:Na+ symporter
MRRERLGSRLGFILLSAGCAIGIGNVWKFPYMVGQNGGGFFVLIYLFFLIVLGVPVMTIEFSMGRASRKSPAKMYQELEPEGTKWHWHGIAALVGNYILMMFYTTVCGWMLRYFVDMARGAFTGLDSSGVGEHFELMLGEGRMQVLYMGISVVLGFLVCSAGLQNGLEKITKIIMTALLVIMIVLAVNSIFMDGGREGLKFYLLPDVRRIKETGIAKVIVSAMNQAFFTLSLGMGAMAIFGSYIDKERSLMGEAVNVALLDTFVAVASGLIIFPSCFAYDVEVTSGPSLIFITLPNIFNNIPLGRLWGSLFFVFMSFAAFSTVLTVFEGIIACTMDITGWSRKKSCLINCVTMFLLSLPCALGFNVLSGFKPFGEGSTVLDLEDFIVSNVILPIGALCMVLFCTTQKGWGWDNFVSEANTGKGIKVKKFMKPYMSYVLPVVITALFIVSIYNFFR